MLPIGRNSAIVVVSVKSPNDGHGDIGEGDDPRRRRVDPRQLRQLQRQDFPARDAARVVHAGKLADG